MRVRLTLTALTGAALLAAPLLTTGSTATAATPMSPVTGGAPLALHGAHLLGTAVPTVRQRITLALALRDQAGLDALLTAQQTAGSADYQHYLSPAQFAARFAPAASSVSLAKAWAAKAGLTVTDVSANRTLVSIEGTRAQLGAAFHTSLRAVHLGATSFVTPTTAATLPASLRAVTAAVTGLTTYNPATLPLIHKTKATKQTAPYQPYGLASYGPKDFWKIYNAPSTVTGTGQTIAVIAQGDLTGVKKDLVTFEKTYGLAKVPMTVVPVGKPGTDTSGADEYDLDTQYATGFAPGLKSLLVYDGESLGDTATLNKFVTDKKALSASASYGGCEVINKAVGQVASDDQVFKQAQAQGQTFWFSSGDEGSACSLLVNTGTPAGVPDVEYPSSSSYVVAVGGTSLTGQSTQPLREISWIGGGGGYSLFEKAPSWQKANLAFSPLVGRGVPDVSLDADPYSGYNVVVDGTVTGIGGTSASTPAWNGIWARVLQKHPKIGFAPPVLYRNAALMTDITLGSNGMYPTTSGYDLNTGVGSANIAKLVASVR